MKRGTKEITGLSISGKMAGAFINSKLTPLLMLVALVMGLFAVLITPREEDPQMKAPMVDIQVSIPGADSREVEEKVTKPLEKVMWEIDGVEYVNTISRPDLALITVLFKVGSDAETSLVKLNSKIAATDRLPPGSEQPLVKLRTADDVPVLTFTLWSEKLNDYQLRKAAIVVEDELKKITDVSETSILGGRKREVTIALDPNRLAAYGFSPTALVDSIVKAGCSLPTGSFKENNREMLVRAGDYFKDAEELGRLVMISNQSKTVYLRDIASIKDGPGEVNSYVFFGAGPGSEEKKIKTSMDNKDIFPAVTITDFYIVGL